MRSPACEVRTRGPKKSPATTLTVSVGAAARALSSSVRTPRLPPSAVRGPERDFVGRFKARGRAVRIWALREPARYGLLFGGPVLGYQAPEGQNTPPRTR